MKKQKYLKESIENLLMSIEILIIGFYCMTIDSLGNAMYNKVFVVSLIVFVINAKILKKYSKTFNED
jgi:uncharacterized membrane protein YiaA